MALNMPGVQRIRFFMTFGPSYLTHLKCLENVGMSTTPIEFEGHQIVPIQFLKALLPDPATLGPHQGQTNIGCIHRQEGRQGKTAYLQRSVTTRSVTARSARRPSATPHRRSGDDRRGVADRQVEQAGRVHGRGV